MKTLTAYRQPNVWTNVLTFFLSLTFMIVWLPFVRSLFDGVSYQWGTEYFGFLIYGAGVTPSFVFLILQLALYVALFVGLYHMRNRKLYAALLGIWWINVFGNLIFDIIVNGDTMFHGDTMNVHISLTAIILPISALALFLVIQVIRSDFRSEEFSFPWTSKNNLMMYLILGPLPIQAMLLASGEPHGITDQIGVIISILQCFLIPFIFRPYAGHSVAAN